MASPKVQHADLTPELLAQLEQDVARWPGGFVMHFGGDVYCNALAHVPPDAPPPDDREFRDHLDVITEEIDWHRGESLARLLSAVPALIAAAKERDQLRVQLQERAGIDAIANALHDADHLQAHIAKQEAEIAYLEERQQSHLATIAKLSQTTPFADEIDGWEGQRAKMIAEVGTLRRETAGLSEQLAESQLARIALAEEVERLRAPAPRKQATTIAELFAARIRGEQLAGYLVAERLQMSPTTVSDILYRRRLPGPKVQRKLARFLRMSVEQLAAMVAAEKEQQQPIGQAEALP